ncbi:hypothetical protein GTP46_12035 [Duganella sp. FT135W]|uniref:Uncharacterized protein n=2 Tax=Duganella flavida TaxID=2692175 RepID=A0A6L8K8M4_9BURK|nr:hypothetical protein [Duganella flavida]
MSVMPKVDTSFPGAGCLLCLAAASMANSSLTTHVQTLPSSDMARVKADMADALRKKGYDVTVIEEAIKMDAIPQASGSAPNQPRKDFSALASKYKVDKLLVIDIAQIGVSRNYSAYVPTSAPQGLVQGTAYLINVKSNTYEWYLPLNHARSASGNWDEAPSFPGLTNAYFQAIEGAHDAVLQPFN